MGWQTTIRQYPQILARQIDADWHRAIYWLPVFLGIGSAIYFSLSFEPDANGLIVVLTALMAAFGIIWAGYWRASAPLRAILAVAVCLAMGMVLAQFRAAWVDTKILSEKFGPTHILGTIEQIDRQAKGGRFLISDIEWLDDIDVAVLPRKLRLSVRSDIDEFRVGDRIQMLAVLSPPTEPAMPGGYDFARQQYFDGIGAVAFSYGKPRIIGHAESSGIDMAVNRLRDEIITRINRYLDGDIAAVSVALITSEESAVSQDAIQDLRRSGLQHILSVSGLHLVLAGGLIFLVTRFLLIWIPGLAIPAKKIAALLAIMATFFYLVISGFAVATERSFIMIGLVFLAILVDREALSMRLVALAAAIVLCLHPESVFSISFQLSFAAVVALISVYESWPAARSGVDKNMFVRVLEYFVLSALTSFIASIATAPIILYHFHQITAQGILANMLANPLVSFWIMPLVILVLLAMPLGLEQWPLYALGIGVDGLLKIASATANMPGAMIMVSAISAVGVLCIVSGGLWVLLWMRPWRYWGILPIVAGCILAAQSQLPDILISGTGKLYGVYADSGQLGVSSLRREKFTAKIWNGHFGQSESVTWDTPELWDSANPQFRCDAMGCVLRRKGHEVSFVYRPEILAEECASSDLVITAIDQVQDLCLGAVQLIDADFVAKHGAATIHITEQGVNIETVGHLRGRRPWTKSMGENDEPESAD